jgi:hypothetical protein
MKKKLLIVFGVFILGIFILGLGWYLLIDVIHSKDYRKNLDIAEAKGREFGRAVDEEGCVTEGLRQIEGVSVFEFEKRAIIGNFIEGCFRTSKAVDGFCDDVPGLLTLRDTEWKEEMCKKAGMPNDMVCEDTVFDEKHTMCNFPKQKE